MEKLKICFVGTDPNFDGGVSVFQKNLISYIKDTKIPYNLTWIYAGEKKIRYLKNEVNYVEFKIPKVLFLEDILFDIKVSKFLKRNNFDIINSHGIWGHWIKNYKKRPNQKIIHTYHGSAYYLLKNSLGKFGILKKTILFPILLFGYFMEKPPIKKADKIVCVSEKVKMQVQRLYGRHKNIVVIRTGVDLKDFKPSDRKEIKRKLGFDKENIYGLYVGRGGFWTKGLDRAINISEEIYKKDRKYRLIVIGPDLKKVKHLVNKKFVIYLKEIDREKIPFYYNAADIFFCMSRYEGGAPTLVVSEAMASGCLIVCSKSSEQEIIENGKNGLILEDFDEKDADKIINVLKDKKKMKRIIKNSLKTIKSISIEKWGKNYLDALMK